MRTSPAMTHYLPFQSYTEMPVSLQVEQFSDPAYTKHFMDVPFVKACVPACRDLGIPIFDDNLASNCNNSSSSNTSNVIIGYSSNNPEDTGASLDIGCEDLYGMTHSCVRFGRIIQSPSLQMDGLRYETHDRKLDPYSPLCMVPLPSHLMEPNFIRRRNERERERVRCVNEGYDKLKEHLPLENKDRRISKVETLRGAIDYIRSLQRLLEESDGKNQTSENSRDHRFVSRHRKRRHSSTSNDPRTSDSDS